MRRRVSEDDPEHAIVGASRTILRDARLCLALRMRVVVPPGPPRVANPQAVVTHDERA
jgi:hypothetical protein